MSAFTNYAKEEILKGLLALHTATLRVALLGNSIAFNPDMHFMSEISGAELNGSGYQSGFAGTGRVTLANKVITRRDAEDRAVFSADPVSWSAPNAGTVVAAAIYRPGTSDADSLLVAYVTLPQTVFNGTPYRIDWLALPDGIGYI